MKLEFTQAEIEDMVRRQLMADGYNVITPVTFLPKKRFMGGKMTAHVLVKKEMTPAPIPPVEESLPAVQESDESG